MKKKIAGLVLLLAVMAVVGIVFLVQGQQRDTTEVTGYLGGEKIGLFEDPEVQDILMENYGLKAEYSRAGSLDMVTADLEGRDYLFPSSSIALEYYEDVHGNPRQSDIIFNTPIVLYTHRPILEAFAQQGLITEEEGVYYVDMAGLVALIQNDTQWSDIGVPQLYGSVSVDTTDPSRSNSGNMFAALLANVLNGGNVVTAEQVDAVLPGLQQIFGRLGYMETSSSDLFAQFLRLGIGAKPIIAGYESQLIEYAAENPEGYQQIRDAVVMLYPSPTVWSSHVMIALDEEGSQLLEALLDPKIQQIAWEKHGFRTGNFDASQDAAALSVNGVTEAVTRVTQVPDYDVMKRIIDTLGGI